MNEVHVNKWMSEWVNEWMSKQVPARVGIALCREAQKTGGGGDEDKWFDVLEVDRPNEEWTG